MSNEDYNLLLAVDDVAVANEVVKLRVLAWQPAAELEQEETQVVYRLCSLESHVGLSSVLSSALSAGCLAPRAILLPRCEDDLVVLRSELVPLVVVRDRDRCRLVGRLERRRALNQGSVNDVCTIRGTSDGETGITHGLSTRYTVLYVRTCPHDY